MPAAASGAQILLPVVGVTSLAGQQSSMISTSTLSDRRGVWAFALGVILVTGGVLLHAPMFLMGRHNHFVLAGMPIGWDMIAGMVAIVAGCAIAAYGLLP